MKWKLAALTLLGLCLTLSPGCGEEPQAPCEVLPGECPNACTAGPAAFEEPCEGQGDCQCGFFCEASTLTCAYYRGVNRGCLCEDVPVMAPGIPILGSGANDLSGVVISAVGTSSDGLKTPRDLAFNPEVPGELWVVNLANPGDERMVVFSGAGTESQQSTTYSSPGSAHFFASPSSLAFGEPGEFASAHETDQFTQGSGPDGTPKDFMGPTLYSTKKPTYDAGHSGHLDMLHNSPLGMGIAWAGERVYWVFDGYHSSLSRYDFNDDHGRGGADHTDGVLHRYVEGEVKRLGGVPSHMAYDADSSRLYVADSGNNRVAVLDTETGTLGGGITPNYDGTTQLKMNGANLWTLIEGSDVDMTAPSGLELHDGLLFVSDNATSRVYALDPDDGALIDWIDLGLAPGALMGIAFDSEGNLWVVDALESQVLKITPSL